MSIVADWTCAKSLKPILRRWKRRSTKSLNPCNLVWTQYIKNHQDTPKNPNPKISPPCCPWSGANGRRFPGAPGRGGGLSGEPRGTVLQPCFNRASTVLQPFNQPHYTHGFHHGIAAKSIHLSQKSKTRQPEIHNFVHARPLPISDTTTPHSVSESEFGSGRACGALGAEATCKPQSGQDRVLNPDTN